MNFEEFLTPEQLKAPGSNENIEVKEAPVETGVEMEAQAVNTEDNEVEVQRAVVEAFAVEKAELEEHIASLRKTIVELRSKLAVAENQLALKTEALEKSGEILAKNADETAFPNKVSLLERSLELEERFPGEMRDHVLEAIKEAREVAEKSGRLRHAQILESVLLANEPLGLLEAKRQELVDIFNAGGNILSGKVLEKLKELGITHKNGEEYLLPKEIIKRTY